MINKIIHYLYKLKLFYDPNMSIRKALSFFIEDLHKNTVQQHEITRNCYTALNEIDRAIINQSIKSHKKRHQNNRVFLSATGTVPYSEDGIQYRRFIIGKRLLTAIQHYSGF